MSVYADGHDRHERVGADTRYIEVCWKCAEEWTAYLEAHPAEAPAHAVVRALRPEQEDALAPVSAHPGDPVASIRLGVHFGDGPGKRFLNVDYPFDGSPEGFDRAWEQLRVRYHEKARASSRPCGYEGPWSQEILEATGSVASVKTDKETE